MSLREGNWKNVRRIIDTDRLAIGMAPMDWGLGVMVEFHDRTLHVAVGPFFVWVTR